MANSKVPLASKVENAVGNHEITDMWKIHFSDLLTSVHNTDSKGFVSNHIDAVDSESHITITASDVLNSLKETKLGKSAGIDGLAAEHFIHSHVSIYNCSFIIIIFMYAIAWIFAGCVYADFNYSHSEKQKW